ncbi:MAG: stage II sporulation protein M [Anaerolineae bacterium]
MQVNSFIKARENDWKRLEALMKRAASSKRLQPDEIRELGGLYRTVMSDLAIAQRDYPTHQVTLFLNQLLMRAHSFIYQNDVTQVSKGWATVLQTIPQTFRQMAVLMLISCALLLIPAVIAYRAAFVNPSIAPMLGLEEQRQVLAEHSTWVDIPLNERPTASTFVITNNIRIAILAFAGGVSFGLFSMYVLTFNGLVLGAVLGLAAHYGMADDLASFIVGHGFLELSIIIIAGGAGLSLGWALLNPGRLTRLNALVVTARRSVNLALLAVPMLIAAGLIEGFISPSNLPPMIKLAIGLSAAAFLYAYLLLAGRQKQHASTSVR